MIVAEQLGSLNSTIEAINRVNAIIEDETGETETQVEEPIREDGVNMQIDSWRSIQRYILMHWETLSTASDVEDAEKQRLAQNAAKAVVEARRKSTHSHGITWGDAMKIIKAELN